VAVAELESDCFSLRHAISNMAALISKMHVRQLPSTLSVAAASTKHYTFLLPLLSYFSPLCHEVIAVQEVEY
jgi:hypothetical protein